MQETARPKILQEVKLVARPAFNIELATGSRGLKLKELNKEVDKFNKSKEEDKQVQAMCAVISEFSDIGTVEDVFELLTQFEILDVYYSIQGDNDSIKKLMSLTSK